MSSARSPCGMKTNPFLAQPMVVIDDNDQLVAQFLGLLENPHMADMQRVEAPETATQRRHAFSCADSSSWIWFWKSSRPLVERQHQGVLKKSAPRWRWGDIETSSVFITVHMYKNGLVALYCDQLKSPNPRYFSLTEVSGCTRRLFQDSELHK